MPTPTELLAEMNSALGDLPEKLSAALRTMQPAGAPPLPGTGGRVSLPMAGQQQQEADWRTPPPVRAFPQQESPVVQSFLKSAGYQEQPKQADYRINQPPVRAFPTPTAQTMPASVPSADPTPVRGDALLGGRSRAYAGGQGGSAADKTNQTQRMIDILEEIRDKLDEQLEQWRQTRQERASATQQHVPTAKHAPEPRPYVQSTPSAGRAF